VVRVVVAGRACRTRSCLLDGSAPDVDRRAADLQCPLPVQCLDEDAVNPSLRLIVGAVRKPVHAVHVGGLTVDQYRAGVDRVGGAGVALVVAVVGARIAGW